MGYQKVVPMALNTVYVLFLPKGHAYGIEAMNIDNLF